MAYRDSGFEAAREVLVVGMGGKLVGLDRGSGRLLWENPLKGGSGEVVIAMRYGRVFASASGPFLFRIDYTTGATVWSKRTHGSGSARIVVEREVVVVGKSGTVECFDHEGRLVWRQVLRGSGVGDMTIGLPDNVAQATGVGPRS